MAWFRCIGNGGSPTPSEGDPYIFGIGTAYSALPVYGDENDILKIQFKFKNVDENADNKMVIGSAFSGNSDYLLYMTVENGQPVYAYAVANNYTYIKAPRSTTDYDDIELGYDYMKVNGVTYTSQSPAKHYNHTPIYVFGSTYTGSGVFGEIKIYKNDTLTYDLVPSVNSSGVACFKDSLNSDTEYLSVGAEYYYFKDGDTKQTQPTIIPVFNNLDRGNSTYTVLEDGLYLIEVSNSYQGSRSITLPSGRTSIISQSMTGTDRGMSIEIVELKSGDEITLSATSMQWTALSKCIFLLKNIEVLSVQDTDYADDTTLAYSSIPSTDNYYMTIGVCFGAGPGKYYDSTVDTVVPLERDDEGGNLSLCSIRFDKGKNFPTLSYYGYDGGGAYLCVLNAQILVRS